MASKPHTSQARLWQKETLSFSKNSHVSVIAAGFKSKHHETPLSGASCHFHQEIMEKKQITPEIEGAIKSAMDEPLGATGY